MIAITGAGGVLGTALRRLWPADEIDTFDGDVRDYGAVETWLGESRAEVILHLAAIVPVGKVDADPRRAFEVNAGGTLNVCEAIRRHGVGKWMFLASSSHVYSPAPIALVEEAPTEPHSLYGFTKLEAERIALTWSNRFAIAVCVGRIFSFSAQTQSEDYLLPSLVRRIRAAESGATLRIAGGSQTRDFMTTAQIARIVAFLIEQRARGVFNVASGHATRIVDIATSLAKILGRDDLRIVADDESDQTLVADTTKLRRLGYEPQNDLLDLLEELAAS